VGGLTLAFSASASAPVSVSASAMGEGLRSSAAQRGPEILLPPAAAGALHIGEVIELRWRGVPSGAEEMELLLSLDGGRTFAVRVTPDLDADRGAFSWRVPPLPARQARLAMRINLAGREVFAGLSAPFRIAATGGRTLPWTVRSRGGDLWLGGPDGDAAGEVNRNLAAGAPHPRISPLWPGLAPGAPESPRPARSRAVAASARRASSRGLAARSRALPAPPRLPMDLPLRI
jgi:hypothetical protein